jgi:hypothetical protein
MMRCPANLWSRSIAKVGAQLLALPFIASVFLLQAAENKVLQLDSPGSYVELPQNAFNSFSNATFEAWVRFANFSYGPWQKVLLFGSETPENFNFMSLSTTLAGENALLFEHYDVPRANGSPRVVVQNLLRTNEWCHLAGSLGSQGIRLYFNGRLVGVDPSSTNGLNVIHGTQTNFVGRGLRRTSVDGQFVGQVDEIRVWNRELSEEEIAGNMRRKLNGDEPGLAGYWTFDDGQICRPGTASRRNSPSSSNPHRPGRGRDRSRATKSAPAFGTGRTSRGPF